MAPSHPNFMTATEMTTALKARRIPAVELAQHAIDRIERHDPKINAVCVRDFDSGLAAARAADEALARGESRPLLGIPATMKESFNIAGLPTTWGYPEHKDYIATEDALAVSRLKAAGAVIIGKTNVPISLGDWQSYNDVYGTTNNPYDLGRTPGGSSGGSSAAVAAGFGAFALGSDIGGSIRVPAFHCGIYGHKPTFALAPIRGHVAPRMPALPSERDLSVIGPMARSAADLTLVLDALIAPDELDMGVGYKIDLPAPRHTSLKGARILILDTHPLIATAASVRSVIETLAGQLAEEGAVISTQSSLLPDFTSTSRLYMRMLYSLMVAGVPDDYYAATQDLARKLDPGNHTLAAYRLRGAVLTHRDWVRDTAERGKLRAQWREVFKSFDAVICPVMPTPAFPHDHTPDQEKRVITIDGQDFPYGDQLVWPGVATLPGLPATAIPLALSADGLPIGLQIIGPWLEDRTPLKFAELIEQSFGGFTPPPAFLS